MRPDGFRAASYAVPLDGARERRCTLSPLVEHALAQRLVNRLVAEIAFEHRLVDDRKYLDFASVGDALERAPQRRLPGVIAVGQHQNFIEQARSL